MVITKPGVRPGGPSARGNVDWVRTDQIFTRLERVFARLDREPERPAHLQVPQMSRHRVVLFGATLVFYLAIVIGVLTTSWLVRLDWQLMFFRPYEQWPQVHAFL